MARPSASPNWVIPDPLLPQVVTKSYPTMDRHCPSWQRVLPEQAGVQVVAGGGGEVGQAPGVSPCLRCCCFFFFETWIVCPS